MHIHQNERKITNVAIAHARQMRELTPIKENDYVLRVVLATARTHDVVAVKRETAMTVLDTHVSTEVHIRRHHDCVKLGAAEQRAL